MIELKNSKTTYLGKASGGDRYTLDAFIGAIQMRESEGQWQDIRPRLVRDADGWHIEGAPYYAEIKDNGSRLFCPDKNERSKFLRLPGTAIFTGLTRDIVSNPGKLDSLLLPNQVTMSADWGEIHIIYSNTGMHFEILFRQSPPKALFGLDSPKILLDTETMGFDIGQLLNSKSGIGVPKPRLSAANREMMMSESQEKWLDWSYKNGQLELGLDFGNMSFPILLKNTTVDLQVESSADDAGSGDSYAWSTVHTFDQMGYLNSTPSRTGVRFLSVNIQSGATIDIMNLQFDGDGGGTGVPTVDIYGEDNATPATFSTQADYDNRTKTTATVRWSGMLGANNTWYTAGELKTIGQELVDSYNGVSNLAFIINGYNTGTAAKRWYKTYNQGSSYAPRLHIEYTAGGVTVKTSTETGAGTDAVCDCSASIPVSSDGGLGTDAASLPGVLLGTIETGMGSELAGLSMDSLSLNAADHGGGVEVVITRCTETGETVSSEEKAAVIAALNRGESCAGSEAAAPFISSGDGGTGSELGVLQKMAFSSDYAGGYDSLKSLIKAEGSSSDMRLSKRQGQATRSSKQGKTPLRQAGTPSKGVNR
jgi:hypothetical protein